MHGKSFQQKFQSKPENAAKAAAEAAVRSKPRIQPSAYPYTKLHIIQIIRLIEINDPGACMLFVILLGESFANKRGKPFELPTRQLVLIPGLKDPKRLRAKLHRLEQAGLITVTARHSKPPMIQVPLAL